MTAPQVDERPPRLAADSTPCDTLRVETNSEPRMDRVLATLTRLDPAMTVLDDDRRPLRNTREAVLDVTRCGWKPTANRGWIACWPR